MRQEVEVETSTGHMERGKIWLKRFGGKEIPLIQFEQVPV